MINIYMEEIYKEYYYLIHELIIDYDLTFYDAEEYLFQLIHVYITYNPECCFEEFFDVITSIFIE